MRTIPELVGRWVEMNGGNAALSAQQLGSSVASLSRYRSGEARPRKPLEDRLRSLVDGGRDLVQLATTAREESRLLQLENTIAGTLDALREEFHRTATISKRQEVLDLVAALVFAHVTSIDVGGPGLGTHLAREAATAAEGLNAFVAGALSRHLPDMNGHGPDRSRFFAPLTPADERFAQALLTIFERDAVAFRALHEAGRNDLINEVFSRFMSTSFVDEKEMGQYLTPPEVTRFMVQAGFHALAPKVQARLLDASKCEEAGILLDPSCGVGSFLAESIRFFHEKVRERDPQRAAEWLRRFVTCNVVGIDKSERMLRLACVNLGLFGARVASLYLANGLAREGADAEVTTTFEGRAQLILTNPPFGATYSGVDISAFAMGRERSRVDSEILFLERYVDWAAPGGVIVSVVPDSVLVNRGPFAQLRAWLGERCDVQAVFSLPTMAFAAAGTSTKTSVLVLRRKETRHGS
jgi:type I restriction-modification system DNA methylase subunit